MTTTNFSEFYLALIARFNSGFSPPYFFSAPKHRNRAELMTLPIHGDHGEVHGRRQGTRMLTFYLRWRFLPSYCPTCGNISSGYTSGFSDEDSDKTKRSLANF